MERRVSSNREYAKKSPKSRRKSSKEVNQMRVRRNKITINLIRAKWKNSRKN